MTPHALAHELERLYGDELEAVVLYGSAVGMDYSQKFSDVNVFCVLRTLNAETIGKANRLVKRWMKKGNPAPLLFSPQYIERSLDVFPMEFLDMQERHEVLFGKNPLASITIDLKNLRHQCESELKGKLIHLRSFYAATCHKPKAIAGMMVESLPTFLTTMRATLRLLGETPPQDARALVEMVATRADQNIQAFYDVIDIRRGASLLPRGDDALILFERYLTEITALTTYVDQLEVA